MPLWTVEGADRNTGNDVVRGIEAPTEELARQEAAELGILVSDIHRSVTDPPPGPAEAIADAVRSVNERRAVEYATPRAAVAIGAAQIPEYPQIIAGARWLNGLGIFICVIGAISMGLGALIFVAVAASNGFFRGAAPGIPPAIVLVVGGLIYFALGTILRMQGSMGLAVRDIARNSFVR